MRPFKKVLYYAVFALTMCSAYASPLALKANSEASLSQTAVTEKPTDSQPVRLALLLDTSNSMDGLLHQAKSQLWDIVNEFSTLQCGNDKQPELHIAIYQYGNDNLSSKEGYIQQVLDFSTDLDEISKHLFELQTDGGEEYCGTVIQKSLQQLDWGKNTSDLKLIFIAGNEPFTQGRIAYKDAITNAKEKGVVVNTIFCGDYQQGITTQWKNGAILSGGEYMAIDHNKMVAYVNTPYDDQILNLNTQLNATYVAYGNLGKTKINTQYAQDYNARELEEVVAVKRAVSKSSRLYNNKSWDLVDATQEQDFEIATVNKKQLPEALQGKSDKELQSYVDTKRKERERIQQEIRELQLKRTKHLNDSKETSTDGALENVMLKAIKKQATLKNYSWN